LQDHWRNAVLATVEKATRVTVDLRRHGAAGPVSLHPPQELCWQGTAAEQRLLCQPPGLESEHLSVSFSGRGTATSSRRRTGHRI